MGVRKSTIEVVKIRSNYRRKREYKIKTAPTVSPKLDKIIFVKYSKLPASIYMGDEKFRKISETRKLINLTGKFGMTCQLNDVEYDELIETRNFGGERERVIGQARNLPPYQTAK